jgi:acetyl-CoA carboxylase beta subunit
MLEIHKKIVLDEDQRPFAVQIPIKEFERLEEVLENYGLSKLMDEVKDEDKLSVEDAKTYYKSLKANVEG